MTTKENNNRLQAIAGTVLFHGLLFLLFILVVFKTPIPPFPETGGNGIEVNFGTSEDGFGDVQPEELVKASNTTSAAEEISDNRIEISTPVRPTAKPILTQDIEDAPTVANATPNENTSESTSTEAPKPEPRKANAAALYKGKKENGGNTAKGEGETGKPGDQGSADGSRTATYHGPGGGSGNSPGDGGNGPGGNGNGPRYTLDGRNANSLPVPRAAFQEEGKVVVEITVDKSGNVINAKPGVRGSTTSNGNLLDIARRAAMAAKFNASADSPEVQKGTITYNFILK